MVKDLFLIMLERLKGNEWNQVEIITTYTLTASVMASVTAAMTDMQFAGGRAWGPPGGCECNMLVSAREDIFIEESF